MKRISTASVWHRKGALRALITALALAGLTLASGCGSGGNGSFASTTKTGATSVSLLSEPWDDLETENVIAQQLLDKLGYQVSVDSLAVDVGAKSMETGKIDGYLGNWWPSQKSTFGSVINSGKVKLLGTLLTGTEYAPAVPGVFASKYHISSLADLAKYGDQFDHKIYGIEPGTPGNATIEKMIKANDYGLGGWTMVPSSTPAMLAQVQRSIGENKPIVFLGWSPHWMTGQYHTVFLKDPKGVWGGGGEIRTLVNSDFATKSPNVTTFLGNLKFNTVQAGQFYYQHDKLHQSYDAIATAWIAKNPATVKKFLDGVTSTSGKSAESVVFGS